jgi:DNA-binding Lrp family transcriptional regulator
VAARIARYAEVHSLYLLSGGHDLEVIIEGDSMKDIALFVAERLAPLPGVNSTSTHFVLRTYKRDGDVFIGEDQDRRLAVSP